MIPFLTRRARLLRQETQEQFAEYMDVDPCTVSRWECGKLEPHPKALASIREIIMRHNPMLSHDYIERSPSIKYVCTYDDFKHGVTCSRGLAEMHGLTVEEMISNSDEFWTEHDDAINSMVQNDPRWRKGEIAFIETVHITTMDWMQTIAAPMGDTGCVLWEGVVIDDDNPHHPDRRFKVVLVPFNTPAN
jgi:transcriptional regulator with XRE-family HTH domain